MPVYELTPGKLDIEIMQGDDWSMTCNVSGDRSNYTAVAAIRPGPTVTAVEEPAVTVGSYAASVTPFTFVLTDTETAALTPGEYLWAARWSNGGALRTFLSGRATVHPKGVT